MCNTLFLNLSHRILLSLKLPFATTASNAAVTPCSPPWYGLSLSHYRLPKFWKMRKDELCCAMTAMSWSRMGVTALMSYEMSTGPLTVYYCQWLTKSACYISKGDNRLWSAFKTVVIIRHNNLLSAIVTGDI